MKYQSLSEPIAAAQWVLFFATEDVEIEPKIEPILQANPDASVFGVTSFQGVLTPDGFLEGAFALIGEESDGVELKPFLVNYEGAGVAQQIEAEMRQMGAQEDALPSALLLFATPGQEEQVLEGLEEIYQGQVPIYGGSAADNEVAGRGRLYLNHEVSGSGALVVAVYSQGEILGEFLGGYLPTRHRGVVTKAKGRTVYEIDGLPAAQVYNTWTLGLLDGLEEGGSVLHLTSLRPVARIMDQVLNIPLYILSHPHYFDAAEQSLSFFTDIEEGDELILMRGTEESLISRTAHVVTRALAQSKRHLKPKGGVLVYCAGCVGTIMPRMQEVADLFSSSIGQIPFIGLASFGEQGRATGTVGNYHGNLMCDVLLF